jgi:deoxyribodipyrimidine photo-lyase
VEVSKEQIVIFWFRRDLRLHDNRGLAEALRAGRPVIPLFIFDDNILDDLPRNDSRLTFIHQRLVRLDQELESFNSRILIRRGKPEEVWKALAEEYDIDQVYFNRDYEPYAIKRDKQITDFLQGRGVQVISHKDQVIFEKDDILKDDGDPYTVYTPYSKKWLSRLSEADIQPIVFEKRPENFQPVKGHLPALEKLGFTKGPFEVPSFDLNNDFIGNYAKMRDIPAKAGTTRLSVHLRFGTAGIRDVVSRIRNHSEVLLKELIWREFFMQILYHFPRVVNESFKKKYDGIEWSNDKDLFRQWCEGSTGFPIVDAGMRELNQTGYMHNRVRMITASFLTKHLLIDWRWGEAYFAEKLLDYELSSNNGNWQWAAGCGCDAAPYFRIFNPHLQQKKFDPDFQYIRMWVPEYDSSDYPKPVVEHKAARERALRVYKKAVSG